MEFIISTDLTTALPKEIGFNFEELKAELAEKLDYYNNLVVTEDTIKEGKAEKAKLNKLREAVESKRKEIKKECMAPYTDFEAKVEELVAMIDVPVAAIDGQLKVFEEQRREEKRKAIETVYDEIVPDEIKAIMPLDRIFDQRWLNTTFKTEAVGEAIGNLADKIDDDLTVLDTIEPEFATAVRAKYMETLDIGAALRHKKALQDAAEAAKKREASMAAANANAACWAPAEPAITTPEPNPIVEQPRIQEKLYLLRLEFHLTQPQATALKQFLSSNGIQYTKI